MHRHFHRRTGVVGVSVGMLVGLRVGPAVGGRVGVAEGKGVVGADEGAGVGAELGALACKYSATGICTHTKPGTKARQAYGVGADVGAAVGGHVVLHVCVAVSAGHGSAPYLVIRTMPR